MDKDINSNGYNYVDLGLPSGTLWAAQNVGASKPTGYGLYFQWGDTIGYTADQVGKDKQFNWSDYKFSINESSSDFSKYTTYGDTLELEDDAANANMGGDWHMPTPDQIQELIDNTMTEFIVLNNKLSGMAFTSKNGNSIFIPAAGCAWDGSINSSGSNGYVWSSLLSTNYVLIGQHLSFKSGGTFLISINRGYGLSVRGVIG